MGKYLVECLTAKYDEREGFLVLFCLFKTSGDRRLVYFLRSDFNFKGNEVPHIEMHRTAEAFKGKPFWLVIEDDPERSLAAEEAPVDLSESFRKTLGREFEKVSDGLADSDRIMERRIGNLVEKEQQLSVDDILAKERAIRGRLGNA